MHLRHSIFRFVYLFLCECGKLHSIAHFFGFGFSCSSSSTPRSPHRPQEEEIYSENFISCNFCFVFVSPFIRWFVSKGNRCRIVAPGTMVIPLYSQNSVRIFAHKRQSFASFKRHTFCQQMAEWSSSYFRWSGTSSSGCYRRTERNNCITAVSSIKCLPYAPNNFHLFRFVRSDRRRSFVNTIATLIRLPTPVACIFIFAYLVEMFISFLHCALLSFGSTASKQPVYLLVRSRSCFAANPFFMQKFNRFSRRNKEFRK